MRFILSILLSVVALMASVDINHASAKELMSLKGIGAKKAQSIIEFRENSGCFKDINELTKVKGIGKKFVDKNMQNLTLTTCKKDTK